MRLEWIEDILAVQDSGSFTAAAENRFLTPSAFTRRIRTIESSIGCKLFDRNKKPVVLYGHALENIDEMRDVVSTLKQLKMQLSGKDVNNKQQVTLTCQHVLSSSYMPKIMKLALEEQGFNIRVKTGTRNDCLLSLMKRDVQFALTYEESEEKYYLDEVSAEQLYLGYETYIPVANVKVNPALKKQIENRIIPVINYPSSIYLGGVQKRNVFSNISPDFRLQKVAESGLVFAMAEFVKHGIGVGWLPKSLVQSELNDNQLISLEDTLPSWKLNIKLSRFTEGQSQLADEFWNIVQQSVKPI